MTSPVSALSAAEADEEKAAAQQPVIAAPTPLRGGAIAIYDSSDDDSERSSPSVDSQTAEARAAFAATRLVGDRERQRPERRHNNTPAPASPDIQALRDFRRDYVLESLRRGQYSPARSEPGGIGRFIAVEKRGSEENSPAMHSPESPESPEAKLHPHAATQRRRAHSR